MVAEGHLHATCTPFLASWVTVHSHRTVLDSLGWQQPSQRKGAMLHHCAVPGNFCCDAHFACSMRSVRQRIPLCWLAPPLFRQLDVPSLQQCSLLRVVLCRLSTLGSPVVQAA